MRLILSLILLFPLASSAQFTIGSRGFAPLTGGGGAAITLDASCTGTGTATNNACSSAMTVTAGDTIVVGCYTNNNSFDPSNLIASDGVNGYYGAAWGKAHPANANDWMAIFVFENSAAGSITPQCSNWEANGMGIAALAFKGTRTTGVLDGASAINLFNTVSSAATNPNAGTAGAPTNTQEAIACMLTLTSSTATTAGSGYSPAGTLTGVINSLALYWQYFINPTTANCNYGTTVAKTYTDGQIALINSANSVGSHALTGFYGVPAAAQTNGASATTAILNGASGTLYTLNAATAGAPWTLLAGSAVTFDTSVHPIGTVKMLLNGVVHTLGDAATSVLLPSANTTTAYAHNPEGLISNGTGEWVGFFARFGTGTNTNATNCDLVNLGSNMTEGNTTFQVHFDTSVSATTPYFAFERDAGATPTTQFVPGVTINLNQDYYFIKHIAGINEPNNELFIFGESTPGTLPWTLISHMTGAKGGHVISTTTATASSGATSITVASATGIVAGQAVYSATTSVDTNQIPLGAYVGNSYTVGSTTVPLVNASGSALATTASMSATPVEFTGNTAFQTCSVTSGSTTLTCGAGTGIVGGGSNTGQFVGMPGGVAPGTWVASGSGTTWTLSQPAIATLSSQPTQFWAPDGGALEMHFGKYSSCSTPANIWYSGFIFDPYANFLPLVANGTIPL